MYKKVTQKKKGTEVSIFILPGIDSFRLILEPTAVKVTF